MFKVKNYRIIFFQILKINSRLSAKLLPHSKILKSSLEEKTEVLK